MYNICNANYCFTDNAADSVNSRANRARLDLAEGNYERVSAGGALSEFIIDFTFNAPVTFNSLTLKKVLEVPGVEGDYMDIYNKICLTISNSSGPTDVLCTNTSYGFFGDNFLQIDPSSDAEQDIVFQGLVLTGVPNIVSAQLTFNTSASGSNLQANDKLKIAQITIDSFFPEE